MRIILTFLFLLFCSGCKQSENTMLENITSAQYSYEICQESCFEKEVAAKDAVTKAEIAGISESRILAAKKYGEEKARRTLRKLAEEKSAALEKKCKSENKTVCYNSCCDSSSYTAAYDAEAPVALEAEMPEDPSIKINEINSIKKYAMDSYRYFYDISNPNDYPQDVYPPEVRSAFSFEQNWYCGADKPLEQCGNAMNRTAVNLIYSWVKNDRNIDFATRKKAAVDYDVLIERRADLTTRESVDRAADYAKDAAKYYYPKIMADLSGNDDQQIEAEE